MIFIFNSELIANKKSSGRRTTTISDHSGCSEELLETNEMIIKAIETTLIPQTNGTKNQWNDSFDSFDSRGTQRTHFGPRISR